MRLCPKPTAIPNPAVLTSPLSHPVYSISRQLRKSAVTIDEPGEDTKPEHQYQSPKTAPGNRLYCWGSANTGALAIRRYLRPEPGQYKVSSRHRPVRVPFAELNRVIDVACGYGFTLVAVRGVSRGAGNHSVFACGLNTDGQLGDQRGGSGRFLEVITDPAPISLPIDNVQCEEAGVEQPRSRDRVIRVAAGRAHSVMVTRDGSVLTVGNNAHGQCCRPVVEDESRDSASGSVHRVHLDEPVVDAVCGQDHTLLLTASGCVMAAGCGSDGQLGCGRLGDSWKLQPVRGGLEGERVVRVAGAGDCVLAVTDSGRLFGWGCSEYSQLATGCSDQQVAEPHELHVPDARGGIVDAAASASMCIALDGSGSVFVWGLGMLGGGPRLSMTREPHRLPAPLFGANQLNPDSRPVGVSAGLHHLTVVTSTGDLYTWGANRHGELGLGHKEMRLIPQRVSIPARVLRVACGVDHMMALCREHV